MVTIAVLGVLITSIPAFQTVSFNRVGNIMQASSSTITAVTSITATIVIGAHIRSSTRLNRRARRRYQHIVEILVQSAALYSIVMLVQAIVAIIDTGDFDTTGSAILNFGDYMTGITSITAVCCSVIFSQCSCL